MRRLRIIRGRASGAAPPPPPPVNNDRRVAIWGQSNAVGYGANVGDISGAYATQSSPYTGALSRVFIFNTGTGNFEPFDLGTNNDQGGFGGTFGPEFPLAVQWMRNTTAGNLYIEKHAQGSVDIQFFQPGNTFFTNDQTYRTQANTWLAAAGKAPIDAGWLFVQGEADAAAGATQSYYFGKLGTLIAGRVSASLQVESTSRNVLSRQGSSSGQYSAAVNAAMTQYAAAHPETTSCIDYTNAYVDGVHLNANAMMQLGYDAYAQMPLLPQPVALWSVLFASAVAGQNIDVSVPVLYDVTNSPTYGVVTVKNGGGRFVVDRTTKRTLNCEDFIVEGDPNSANGAEFYGGSRAIAGTAIGNDPFPLSSKWVLKLSGARTREQYNTVLASEGGGTNLSNPAHASMSTVRAFTAMPGSRVFMEAAKRRCTSFKVTNTINIGDTTMSVAAIDGDTPGGGVDAYDGEPIYLSTTKYNSENPTHNLSNWDHLASSNFGAEVVYVVGNFTNSTSLTFRRDPAVAGTGAQFRHFGKLQYKVAKSRGGVALEDIPYTNLSLTDWGLQAGDNWGTVMGTTITGQQAIDAFAGLPGEAGAGGTRGRVVDHRAVGAFIDAPFEIQSVDDNDWRQHGYGVGFQGMGRGSYTIMQRRGVLVRRGGKAGQRAAYSFHDHLRGVQPWGTTGSGTDYGNVDSARVYMEQCYAWEASNHPFTIHGTHGLKLVDVVACDYDSHGIFEEDGFEKNCEISATLLGGNRINHQIFKNCTRYGLTPSYKAPIKEHEKILTVAYLSNSQYYRGGIDYVNAGFPLGCQGPAAVWHSNPSTKLKRITAIGCYNGVWNNFQRKTFGFSRDAVQNSFRTPLPKGNIDNIEVGCAVMKNMTTNPHVSDESGNLMAGPGSNDIEFDGDSYQYGASGRLGNQNQAAYADREFFTNCNFWKTDNAIYSNEAHGPQYEGWHVYGASGKGHYDDLSHHDRYMVFGNGRPTFRAFIGGPNTLDDPYPFATRPDNELVTMFLSYGAGSMEHSSVFAPQPMTTITSGNNDELVQRGGLMHFWDFYLFARYSKARSLGGLCRNTVVSGGCPGVFAMHLPAPFLFATMGQRFKNVYDVTNPATPHRKTSRNNQSTIKLPDDKSVLNKAGGWWINGDSPHFLYNTGTDAVYVTPSMSSDTAQTMNGVYLPPSYNFYALQTQLVNGTDAQIVNPVGSPQITHRVIYQRMQDDFVTPVANGAVDHPQWTETDGESWYNMRHSAVEDGEKMHVDFPNIATINGFGLLIGGMDNRYEQFAGAHMFVSHKFDPSTNLSGKNLWLQMMGVANVTIPPAASLAALRGSSTMCYFVGTDRVYFHIVQPQGGAWDAAYGCAIRFNCDTGNLNIGP